MKGSVGKRKKGPQPLRIKFFGNIEYLEDNNGHVVQINATNGVFKIKNENLGESFYRAQK